MFGMFRKAGVQAMALAALFSGGLMAAEPTLGEIAASPESPATGEVVTLTVPITLGDDPNPRVEWDFDTFDGQFVTEATGNPVVNTFATEDLYFISVRVTDSLTGTVVQQDYVLEVVDLPPVTDPGDLNEDDPDAINPDLGFALDVSRSTGGFIELDVETTGAVIASAREDMDFSTDWGDGLAGRGSGIKPRHQYETPSVWVASTTVKNSQGVETGKLRKTLVISSGALGLALPSGIVEPSAAGKTIKTKKVSGKFIFSTAKNKDDKVGLDWEMSLPQGFQPIAQEMVIAVGNVKEKLILDDKGRAAGTIFKKVQVKFPKLKKGQMALAAETPTKVKVSMLSTDLDKAGFDSEGISPRGNDNPAFKSVQRTIQIGALLSGVPFSGQANVSFKVTKNDEAGVISGRGAQ